MQTAPFRFGTVAEGEAFTDREIETQRLVNNFSNGINTILISPRRWGKSSLVKHAASRIPAKRKIRLCFIDLFNVRSEEEFYEILSREVIKAGAGKWQQWLKDAGAFFKQLVPRFQVSPGPEAELSVALDWKEVKKYPGEILNLAESICKANDIRMVICIDEFQNIGYYDDPVAFQKKLRAHWQHHQHVSYCLYGSRRHMLMDFFTSASMPFYRFGDLMFLEKIPSPYWIPFIVERFDSSAKKIDDASAARITELMKEHPYFVQQLSQQCWLITKQQCTENTVYEALENLLQQHHFLYQREMDQLTTMQVNFLEALTDGVTKFTSSKNLEKYKTGTSANVKRIREALENKEIIDTLGDRPEILDPLFEIWLKQVYFNKKGKPVY